VYPSATEAVTPKDPPTGVLEKPQVIRASKTADGKALVIIQPTSFFGQFIKNETSIAQLKSPQVGILSCAKPILTELFRDRVVADLTSAKSLSPQLTSPPGSRPACEAFQAAKTQEALRGAVSEQITRTD